VSTAIETEHVLNLHREAILSNLKQTKIMNLSLYSEPDQNFLRLPHSRKLIQNPAIKNIMRIGIVTIILLIATSLQLLFALPAKSQPIDKVEVTLGLNNETLVQAFQKIEAQSPFHFMYRNKEVKSIRNLKVKSTKQSVEDFLKTILAGTSLTYRQVDNQILIVPAKNNFENPTSLSIAEYQKLQYAPLANIVTGGVTNSKGEPLVGVSVTVKGATTGTSTDGSGNYSIDVPANGILVFSYVGYTTREIKVNGRSSVGVVLEENVSELNQVVVVGYGTKKRGEITGAVSDVSGKTITETSENNITQAIQGKIAGVVVNDRGGAPGDNNAEFLIRGKATLGDNSPLIVIDGVPRSTDDFAHIASNDVESISVLKDASAAIYGARAANGVILITTKRGHSGNSMITLSSDYGIQSFNKFPKVMTSFERAEYFNEWHKYNGLQPLWSDDALQHFKEGDEPLKFPDTDWSEAILADHAPQTHHNLSVQGGNNKVQYYISGDLLYQKGLLKSGDMDYKQFQIRSNLNANISDNLKVGMDLMGRKSKEHTPLSGGDDIFGNVVDNYPWTVVQWPNGSLQPGLGDYGNTPYTDSHDEFGTYDRDRYIFNSNLSIEYKIPGITGLKISGYASFDFENSYEKAFSNIWEVYNYDPDTDQYLEVSKGRSSGDGNGLLVPRGSRQVGKNNNFISQSLYHAQVSYAKSFGNHRINGFVAYEQSSNSVNFFTASRQDLPTALMPYLFAGGQGGKDNNGYLIEGGRINYFGSLSYDYDQKYLVDFTFRRDGSFNFAKGKQYGQFPAVSAGWNISQEPFMRGASGWLDNLKIRASWGKMGNDRVPSYQFLTIYGFSDFYAFGQNPVAQQQLQITQVANPNITWETSTATDIGVDFIAWNSLLNFSIDVFSNKRRDILVARNASVPDYTAITLPDENLGKVDSKGVELTINHKNKIGAVGYHVGGNLTYNKNKIVFMDEAKDVPDYQRKEGHPMDSWLVYQDDGLFRSQTDIDKSPHMPGTQLGDIKYVDVDGDGAITGKDQIRKYTSPTPRAQFGFNAGANYRNISLDIFFQGQAGAQQNIFYGEGINPVQEFYTKRWTPDNPNAEFPRAFDRDDPIEVQPSTFWLYNASFLRLKNVRLMYTLPKSLIPQISNLDVYINARNLITWDSMLGDWDPERTEGSGYRYPQVRTITFGIDISF
jgi:TonB-linked SusC/RagA family outer membrane protein